MTKKKRAYEIQGDLKLMYPGMCHLTISWRGTLWSLWRNSRTTGCGEKQSVSYIWTDVWD